MMCQKIEFLLSEYIISLYILNQVKIEYISCLGGLPDPNHL